MVQNGLVSKNKMAATAISFKFLGTFAAPVYQRACNVHFPNLQDMFIMVKASLGIIAPIKLSALQYGQYTINA